MRKKIIRLSPLEPKVQKMHSRIYLFTNVIKNELFHILSKTNYPLKMGIYLTSGGSNLMT
ncbi:ORF183 [White spot syndrome virus]|uniref:ORF183 n=1 Tax=White spot syndrome virus TaxID=342409 RepID=A0A2D3I768_9VIRU|nr:ORF183 [White spot syndrome virus]